MGTKKTIRNILFVAMWMVIGTGMLILLLAAMNKQKRNNCRDYIITIKGGQDEKFFMSKAAIRDLLRAATKGNIKGQSKKYFNLLQMEELLEKNVWIKDAQLYFDNKDVLHVLVNERQPIARIFTTNGGSFYLDEDERILQLSERLSARVPVFTGFPEKRFETRQDSSLLHDIRATAQLISNNPFWTSQVAQIDMYPGVADGLWEFDMIPLIGNHIVKLGNGVDMEKKLGRLFIFYKQVLSRMGFDKYKTVDVRFSGQVVGVKNENLKED